MQPHSRYILENVCRPAMNMARCSDVGDHIAG
jgi:hypothetical protein